MRLLRHWRQVVCTVKRRDVECLCEQAETERCDSGMRTENVTAAAVAMAAAAGRCVRSCVILLLLAPPLSHLEPARSHRHLRSFAVPRTPFAHAVSAQLFYPLVSGSLTASPPSCLLPRPRKHSTSHVRLSVQHFPPHIPRPVALSTTPRPPPNLRPAHLLRPPSTPPHPPSPTSAPRLIATS